MATHIIDSFSEFIRGTAIPADWENGTFVVPSSNDAWWIGKILGERGINNVKIFTDNEFREHLWNALSMDGKICPDAVVDLYFNEMASGEMWRNGAERTLVECKKSMLRTFFGIMASGVKFETFFDKNLCSIFNNFHGKISENGYVFAQDVDRILLERAKTLAGQIGGAVIFYGFQPFAGVRVLMEAAAKFYARAEAISYDFGDGEFVHLWINTLEEIFGEYNFFQSDGETSGDLNFLICKTVYDEASIIFDKVCKIIGENSTSRIALCFGSSELPQIPMLIDKMENAAMPYCDAMGLRGTRKRHATLLALWADWQIGRGADAFCKFCVELAANDLLQCHQCEKIIKDVNSLLGKCLSRNYDVLLEFANIKNLTSFDSVEKYDIHGVRFPFKNFCKNFTEAFCEILPPPTLDALQKQLHLPQADAIFFRKNLVKYFTEFATADGRNGAPNFGANVVLSWMSDAHRQDFTHVFAIGMDSVSFAASDDNFLLNGDAIDRINAHVISASTSSDPTIRSGHNCLMSAQSKAYLEKARLDAIRRRSELTLSYAVKSYAANGERSPASIFTEMFYESRGEFYSKEVEAAMLSGETAAIADKMLPIGVDGAAIGGNSTTQLGGDGAAIRGNNAMQPGESGVIFGGDGVAIRGNGAMQPGGSGVEWTGRGRTEIGESGENSTVIGKNNMMQPGWSGVGRIGGGPGSGAAICGNNAMQIGVGDAAIRGSVKNCATSYVLRHDLSIILHKYCFAADKTPCVKISCKALEYLLKNPHIAFYDTILGLQTMPWRTKDSGKKLLFGSLTHEFLQIFEAGNKFLAKSSPGVFIENIKSRAQRLKASVKQACAAADTEVPPEFDATVDGAATAAKRLVSRLFAVKNWESFSSEYSISRNLAVNVNGEQLMLSGRLDFLVSGAVANAANRFAFDATIIDFKTGSDPEMTEKNIKWHMQKFLGVQLLLYGIALRTIGFERVNVMVLKPDSGSHNAPISVDYAIDQASELMAKLAQFARTGFVERQILGKNYGKFFVDRVPLATTDMY